ncbi:MAG: ABC-F family ATP-binding cassette domain-containing protein [Bacteroidales bacterium]|nr:ABC-F family ATP-binding cassette domain-containing protein [Bacteroidales bacterium]MDY4562179.1 ABC-F family ATP-binding cassette domain-containing protein [Candidatus Cryptobacteroides sp.]MDY6170174.1 ABC-F family ATP-binding cassette domain-containing protein [Candidatus Cryptobacteroides sp.]
MISINSVTVSYGGFTLLSDINFNISEQDKIGLVGKNGAGKSTMLKLICGLQNPTTGKIAVPGSVKIGYLPQIMEHHKGKSVIDETMTAFQEMFDLEAELERVTAELGERTDYESESYSKLIVHLNELNDRLAILRNDAPEVQAEKTLLGLGFKYEELGRPTETFSQGWNMRIELAKILLGKPDVMLLDEPTNHLDIESIEWLEDYLKNCRCSIVLISHDRKFLDNVTNRTIEIMLGKIHDYKVPYSKYLELRKERLAQQRAAYENQQRMIEKTEDFIERFRYKPTKSNQVQSRVKQLEKLERIEVDMEDKSALSVKFPPAPRSGDIVYKAENLTLGYDSKIVFSGAEIEIRRGEKVALVGRNGEGKTTLMRAITGSLRPMEGTSRVGYNVSIGYYEQNQEDVLDKQDTVFGTLDRIAVGDIRLKLRDILAAFLFKGEDIDKKVAVLSGGERARLAMAKLMLRPYNLLCLDEPTNHMDILSKDILKQALKAYDGTLVVVSHDRDFLDGLVDKVYEFRDGQVKEFLGGVSDFLEKRRLDSLNELERKQQDAPLPTAKEESAGAGQYRQNKFISKEEKKLRNRISYLEKKIDEVQARMKEIETVLANPSPSDDYMELTREFLERKRDLDAMTDEWAELSESLEQ